MDDPYKTLGVDKSATDAEIKKAYRKLAKKYHPDLNPSDKVAEAKFKDISTANDLLGDPEKRAKFDRGEIDSTGADRPEYQYYKQYGGRPGAQQYASDSNFEDMGGIFSQMFGQRQAGGRHFDMRGSDARYNLGVDFLDAVNGNSQRITLPDGAALDVKIPQGIKDGQTIRLRGKGHPGTGNGPPGDAYVEITVRPHKLFRREGDDIVLDVPITFDEAVLGGKIDVPTIDGRVRINVPAGASSGQTLRLKGKGVQPRKGKAGDQRCVLKIVMPKTIDGSLRDFAENWRHEHAYDPRKDM